MAAALISVGTVVISSLSVWRRRARGYAGILPLSTVLIRRNC
jgi:hypothetical protein